MPLVHFSDVGERFLMQDASDSAKKVSCFVTFAALQDRASCRARKGMVIIVQPSPQGRQARPGVVSAVVIADLKPPHTKEMTQRIYGRHRVLDNENTHDAAPQKPPHHTAEASAGEAADGGWIKRPSATHQGASAGREQT